MFGARVIFRVMSGTVFSTSNSLLSGNVLNRRTPSVVYVRIDPQHGQ